MMTERIIELTRAGFKIQFDAGSELRISVSRDGYKQRDIISFDQLKMSCLPAETIVMCAIEKMVDEINERARTDQSRMLIDFGI